MAPTSPRREQAADRRQFMAGASQAALGSALLAGLAVPRGVHAQAASSEILKVGLVGCGGRGKGAARDALKADAGCRLTALGDAFTDQLSRAKEQLGRHPQYAVEEKNCFAGFNAYRDVIDSGVDVVLLATPPHFRPEHYRYAVEQGKHCFVEKPVAVDAPGVRSVMETNKLAKQQSLSIVSGLCWRYHLGVLEIMRRIKEERMIGDVVSIQADYLTSTLWHRGDDPAWSRMEYQMRNWLYHTWLSGDHNTEQHVHTLDKVLWLMDDQPPVAAVGMGGRIQRTDPKFGDIYDHFAVVYEFENGLHAHCYCRQQSGCANHNDAYVTGTQGHAEILAHQIGSPRGTVWEYEGPKPSMYELEHQALFNSIRSGRPIHNGDYMAKSTMMAVLGRNVAYTGQKLSWEECLASDERLGPEEYAWTDDVPEPRVAIPGKARQTGT